MNLYYFFVSAGCDYKIGFAYGFNGFIGNTKFEDTPNAESCHELCLEKAIKNDLPEYTSFTFHRINNGKTFFAWEGRSNYVCKDI